MAITSGDGPNRGKSAPPPKRLPKPKAAPQDDGPRGDRDRPRPLPRPAKAAPARPAPQRQAPAQSFFQVTPARTSVLDVDTPRVDSSLFERKAPVVVQIVPEQPKVQIVEEPLPNPWAVGTTTADGQPVDTLRGLTPDIQGTKDRAQIVQNVADQYNVKARLGRRDAARIARENADRDESAKPLTAKEWAALNPLQQAAVQANADLAQAVALDFKTQSKHDGSDATIKSYQDSVSELFGNKEGGTGFKGLEFAPNTLAFLKERGLDQADLYGKDLDDLVSGDALLTMDSVKALAQPEPGQRGGGRDIFYPGPANPREANIRFAEQLARGQLEYQEKMAATLAKGEQLLTDVTSRSTNAAAGRQFGALQLKTNIELPDVRPETLGQIEKYMEALARTDIPLDTAIQTIKLDLDQRGANEKEASQVYQALMERSRQAATGEGKWFEGIDFKMRTPIEVSQALGAPTLKRAE